MKTGFVFLMSASKFGKRLFLSGILGMAMTQASVAQQGTFNWSGSHTFVLPADPPPVIDARNFVVNNGAIFGVDMTFTSNSFLNFNDFLYTTANTLNYTNRGTIIGVPGYNFAYFPNPQPQPQPGVPFSHRAGTFANIANGLGGGAIYCTNIYGNLNIFSPTGPFPLQIPGLAMLKIDATNIIDNGLIQMDNTGLIDLSGDNLDLRRASFNMFGGLGAVGYNIIDWGSGGFGTNSFFWDPSVDLTPTTASSALFASSANFFGFEQMILTNSTPYFESPTGVGGGNNIVWRGIFLQDNSPANVTKNVYFGSSVVGGGAFHIEWVGVLQDPISGAPSTNYFYLSDVPANRRSTNFSFTTPPDSQSQFFGDFTLTASTVRQVLGPPAVAGFVNPAPPGAVSNDFSYINAELTQSVVTNEVFGHSVTNVPGRLHLTANQSLNLANTRITGPNYLSLSAPVDFQGNSNALISAQFSDLNLGVINGSLAISNLLTPSIPAWTGITNAPSAVFIAGFTGFPTPMGGIQAWSASFIFIETNQTGVITNDVRVLLVNSAIEPAGAAFQQDVKLRTGNNNLVVSDHLNIFRTFSSDARILTVTTNGPGAFVPFGELNLLSPDIFWSSSLPNLQYLTNWGEIDTKNLTVFAGNLSDPFTDPNTATPYQAFVNHGVITNQGTFIRAGWFENSGVIAETAGGSIDIVASTASATNGSFIAPGGFVSISANSFFTSNGVINAGGGALTLNTPCLLSDGYVFGNQFGHITNATLPNVVTNGNTWITSGGIKIPVKPPTADLLGTTVTNIALNNFVSINQWPGEDRGCSPAGFTGNLALGRMIFDADGPSEFAFVTTTGNNALYVDSLEFRDNVTNTSASGDFPAIVIQPGMKIYYAQALMNGVSIAEKLNGKNGGAFCWVSNYAGVYSSTNLVYPDGNTYIFNEALVISPNIASGGPDGSNIGIVNINNAFPIPTNQLFDITPVAPIPCDGGGDQGNNGGTDNGTNSGGTATSPGTLTFPTRSTGAAAISFTIAQGAYNGLFYETNGVKPASSGYLTAKVTSKGGFTAKLQLGASVYSFSGQLDANGHLSGPVSGKGLAPLTVEFQLVNNDQITGHVSGNGWSSQLLADRAPFSSKNPTHWAGKNTLLLPSNEENSTTAVGNGFGTVTINSSGAVQWSGVLPDGTKVTQKSALSKNGIWPLYSSLYGGSGSFIGWLQCTNRAGSDIEGSAVWIMPAGNGVLYPGGLTNELDAVGSVISGKLGFTHGTTVLSGAELDSSITNSVTVFGKAIQSSNGTLKLSVNPQTGLFNGSVMDPNSGQNLLFQGALVEKSGIGGGFFLNADQSGKVYFGPAN